MDGDEFVDTSYDEIDDYDDDDDKDDIFDPDDSGEV